MLQGIVIILSLV